MTKTAKISKEIFSYLRDNEKEVRLVLKSLEKRRKNDLSIELDNSSQTSQSAIVEVDLTGMKPIVLEGENAIRDMPVVQRKRKLVIPQPEPEQVEEEHNEDEHLEEEEEQNLGNISENEQDEEVEEQEEEEVEQEDAVILAQKLQDIVDNVYDAVMGTTFNRNITQVPVLELTEFNFDPLPATSSESLHLSSFNSLGLLAKNTRAISDGSYSLRCYNTYLGERSLVKQIMNQDNSKTEAQVIYSLKEKFQLFQTTTVDFELDWQVLKKCCSRGKALYDFMKELNLGTYCNSFY